MGSGKSTIGKKLRSRLPELKLIDTDKVIVEREGMSIADLFAKHGEEHFRKLESELLGEVIQLDNCIVSTGGGLPMWGDNMECMNSAGLTIYLNRSAESIISRMSAAGREKRPKLRGLNDAELLDFMRKGVAEREHIYSQSRLAIEVSKLSDNDILDKIESYIEL